MAVRRIRARRAALGAIALCVVGAGLTGCTAAGNSSYALLDRPAEVADDLPPLPEGALDDVGVDPASARFAGSDGPIRLFGARGTAGVCLLAHSDDDGHIIVCAPDGVSLGLDGRAYLLVADGADEVDGARPIGSNVVAL